MSVPFELAKRVTSYFDWNINEHLDKELEETWPKIPADFGHPKHFHWSTKSIFVNPYFPKRLNKVRQ